MIILKTLHKKGLFYFEFEFYYLLQLGIYLYALYMLYKTAV